MRTKLFCSVIAILALSLLASGPVWADSTTDFSYQAGGNTFTWQLPTDPTITPGNAYPDSAFTINNVTYTENGVSSVGTFDFFTPALGGGFDLWIGNFFCLINAYGPQIYNGSENDPTFVPGTYWFADTGNGCIPTLGVLKVVNVPEPSALLLLVVGLGAALSASLVRKA